MKVNIDKAILSKLLKAQQGELDAVVMYRKLSEKVKDEDMKKLFLEIAKDEGKHAGILKSLTGEILMPNSGKANLISILYSVLGLKRVLKILSNGEYAAAEKLGELAKQFETVEEIVSDEKKHGDALKLLMSKL